MAFCVFLFLSFLSTLHWHCQGSNPGLPSYKAKLYHWVTPTVCHYFPLTNLLLCVPMWPSHNVLGDPEWGPGQSGACHWGFPEQIRIHMWAWEANTRAGRWVRDRRGNDSPAVMLAIHPKRFLWNLEVTTGTRNGGDHNRKGHTAE